MAAGCRKLFWEQVSSVAERGQLDAVPDYVREGDTLVVTKLGPVGALDAAAVGNCDRAHEVAAPTAQRGPPSGLAGRRGPDLYPPLNRRN
jgi:hypothetical protein